MMQLLTENPFKHTFFDEKTGIFLEKWLPNSVNMTENEFKNEVHITLNLIEQTQSKNLLLDNRDFFYTVIPEIQTWILENAFTKFAILQIKKVASLVSKEMISQMSIEQTFDENQNSPFMLQYFTTQEDAETWLLAGKNEFILNK